MKKKSKLKTIYQAFTENVDTSTDMYQERLETCSSCEYNSDNVESENLKGTHRLTVETVCKGSPVCTACGCCIYKKIGQKTENCGLSEIGEEPKWYAVKVETSKDRELDVEFLNDSAKSVSLTEKGDAFVVDLGDVTESVKVVDLLITRNSGLNISSIKPGCSCTVPTQEKINENTVKISAKINTAGFTNKARFSKNLTVYYFVSSAGTRSSIIKLTGIKK